MYDSISSGSKRGRFLQRITKEIIDARKLLKSHPFTQANLPTDEIWKRGLDYSVLSVSIFSERHMDSHEIIREPDDYIRIDDFYSKLVERDSYIKNNQVIDDFTLAE